MTKKVVFKTNQSDTDFAYLAGIIDGEGCFYIGCARRNNPPHRPVWQVCIKISSCDVCLIEWLETTFGGSTESRHRYTSKRKFERPVYAWNIYGEMIDYVLPKIYPYLVIKKRHADVMFEYRQKAMIGYEHRKVTTPEMHEIRTKIMLKMRQLNTRFHNHPLKNPSALSPT